MVPNLRFEGEDSGKYTDTVYFKSLRTLSNANLPLFKNSPSLLISPYTGMVMNVTKVTNDYYIVKSNAGGIEWDGEDMTNLKYDLLIIYRESK